MAISLAKGQRISLDKTAPGLTVAQIGLGWDVRQTDGAEFDLDASVILCGADGKAKGIEHFCFYNNKSLFGGAVEHLGDNRTGEGDGDDETIKIDLARLPADITKAVVLVTIDQADQRRQSFGQVESAYVRVVDAANGQEALRFDLTEDASTETAMIFAELYRKDGGWSFNAMGQGKAGGLAAVAGIYGLDAA